MKALYYHLHLLEPTLVTALEGDPNSAVAFDYIPGSVIRGAVIGLFLRQSQMFALDATDDAIRRVFFSGTTQYLNAYPLVNGERSLPIPKSWHTEKGEKTPIRDFAWATDHPENPKGVSGFAVAADRIITKASEKRFIAAHTQRDRQKGRATKDSGDIYRYDSLAAGQIFAGAILCENDGDAEWLNEFIHDGVEIQIGGARSAGYGRVRFEHVATQNEWTKHPSRFEAKQPLVVTLLSDALVRNEWGEYEPNLTTLCSTLARRLNIAPEMFGTTEQSYLETTLVGGFNRKWGLPLPQTAALKMGSTVVFTGHSLNREQVDWLMRWGIGERRTEGFGRVGINIYTLPSYELPKGDIPASAEQKPQPIELYTKLPARLAQRKLRQLLGDQIIVEANKIHVQNPPRSSQINALRQVVQNALRTDPIGLEKLDEAIQHINKRVAARRQFDKARVGNVKLTDWVSNASKADDKWDTPVKSLLDQSKVDREQEQRRYNLHLVDAVLARAAKEAQQKGNGDE